MAVTIGGTPLFTGVMMTPSPTLKNDRKSVAVSGYYLPGVLMDCPIPASAFPLEFNNQNLREIARTVAKTFGIAVDFKEDPGPIFERVAADPTTKAFAFLFKLARQRNFVISSTPDA